MLSHVVPMYHLHNGNREETEATSAMWGGVSSSKLCTRLLHQVYIQLMKEWEFGVIDEAECLSQGHSPVGEPSVAIKGPILEGHKDFPLGVIYGLFAPKALPLPPPLLWAQLPTIWHSILPTAAGSPVVFPSQMCSAVLNILPLNFPYP